MKKVLLLLLVLAVGGAGGVIGYRRWLARPAPASSGTLRLFGHVDVRDAQLAFFYQERIDKLLVEEGARVEPGQLLATLHHERLDAQLAAATARVAAQQALVDRLEHGTRPEEVEQARANVTAAQARVDNARRLLDRLQETAKTGASSQQALDDATAELDTSTAMLAVQKQAMKLAVLGPREEDKAAARATLSALSSDRDLLQRQLQDCELRAPAKGVIRNRILEPGEMAAPDRPVLTLALPDPKWVRAYVPEPQLASVKYGMAARVTGDGAAAAGFDGWVGFVSPVAEFTPKVVETVELRPDLVYEVRVYVHDPDDSLPLGAPVTVDIDTEGGTGHAGKRR